MRTENVSTLDGTPPSNFKLIHYGTGDYSSSSSGSSMTSGPTASAAQTTSASTAISAADPARAPSGEAVLDRPGLVV
jgi:hypothetical protein